MNMRAYEWKKILLYHKGIFFLVLYMTLILIQLVLFDQPANQDIWENCESYHYYLLQVEGQVDENKEKLLEKIAEEFSTSESRLQTIYQDYSDGKLNNFEYRTLLADLDQELKRESGFQALYDQYLYVRENFANRYLLDTNAWDALLSEDSLNILLSITIMVLSLLLFGTEINNEMDILIRVSEYGEKRAAKEKLIVISSLSVGLCLLDFLMRLIFYQYKYGFTHGDYPLQSLDYFAEYTGNCSLFRATCSILLLRMFGCWFWALFVSAVIIQLKKYSLALVSSLSPLLLLYYGLPDSYIKYYIPCPLGFMIGTGYFQGSKSSYDEYTNQEIITFIQVSEKNRNLVILISILFMILLAFYIIQKYTNCWNKGRTRKIWKKFLAVAVISITVTGCSIPDRGEGNQVGESQAESFYNINDRLNFESEKYLVYLDCSDNIICHNKETSEDEELVRDVFSENKEIYPFFFGADNRIYYLELSCDQSERGMSKKYDQFSVICVNLEDFSCSVIYSDNADIEPSTVLGLGKSMDDDADFYQEITAFVVDQNTIYFMTSDEVWQFHILTGKKQKLFSYYNGDISWDEDSFYYLDEQSRLVRYDVDSRKVDYITDVVASEFVITGRDIVYTDRMNHDYLTVYDPKDGKKLVVSEEDVLNVTTDGNSIFYSSILDTTIYKFDLSTGETDEIGESSTSLLYAFRNYEQLYECDYENKKMNTVSKQR